MLEYCLVVNNLNEIALSVQYSTDTCYCYRNTFYIINYSLMDVFDFAPDSDCSLVFTPAILARILSFNFMSGTDNGLVAVNNNSDFLGAVSLDDNFNSLFSSSDTIEAYNESTTFESIVLEKTFKPNAFNASADLNFIGSQWYLDFSKLIFFFFFFACTSLYFFFLYFFQVLSANQEFQNFSRETRGLSRAQFGDTLTAVIPMTWSITMLMHANVNSNNFDENTTDCNFILTITAYQWGWNYYFPRDINSLLTNTDKMVGHNSVFRHSGYDANFYNILFDFYRFLKFNKQTFGSFGGNYYGKNVMQSINSLYLRSNVKDFIYELPLTPFSNFSSISSKMVLLNSLQNLNIVSNSSIVLEKTMSFGLFNNDTFFINFLNNKLNYINIDVFSNNSNLYNSDDFLFSNYFSDFINFNLLDFNLNSLVSFDKLAYSLDSFKDKSVSSRFILNSLAFNNTSKDYFEFLSNSQFVNNFSRLSLIMNSFNSVELAFLNKFDFSLNDNISFFYNKHMSFLDKFFFSISDSSAYFSIFDSLSDANLNNNIIIANTSCESCYSFLFNLRKSYSFLNYKNLTGDASFSFYSFYLLNVKFELFDFFFKLSKNVFFFKKSAYSLVSTNYYNVMLLGSSATSITDINLSCYADFYKNLFLLNTQLTSQKFNRLSSSNLDPVMFNYKLSDESLQLFYSNSYLYRLYTEFKVNLLSSGSLNFSANSCINDFYFINKLSVFGLNFFNSYNNNIVMPTTNDGALSNRLSNFNNKNSVEYFYKNNDDLDINFIFKYLLPDVVSTRNLNKINKFNNFFNKLSSASLFKNNLELVNIIDSNSNLSYILFNFFFFKNTVASVNSTFLLMDSYLSDLKLSSLSYLFKINKFNVFKNTKSLVIGNSNVLFSNTFNFSIIDTAKHKFSKLLRSIDNNTAFTKINDSVSNQKRLNISKGILLPSDINIHIICGSKDVIHSWAIPGLGIKIDCIPGFNSHRRLNLRWRGAFWGQCMEVCGRYHHWMPILVRVVHKDQFLMWCLCYLRILNKRNQLEKQLIAIEASSLVWVLNSNNFYNYKNLLESI